MGWGTLLATHRDDGIRSLERLPANGLSGEGGRSLPAPNARIPGLEAEEHVRGPVFVDILQGILDRSRLDPSGAKADRGRVDGGGIKGGRCKDGHLDVLSAFRVDAVREFAGTDVESNLKRKRWGRFRRRHAVQQHRV